jgi:hypothetical protein
MLKMLVPSRLESSAASLAPLRSAAAIIVSMTMAGTAPAGTGAAMATTVVTAGVALWAGMAGRGVVVVRRVIVRAGTVDAVAGMVAAVAPVAVAGMAAADAQVAAVVLAVAGAPVVADVPAAVAVVAADLRGASLAGKKRFGIFIHNGE